MTNTSTVASEEELPGQSNVSNVTNTGSVSPSREKRRHSKKSLTKVRKRCHRCQQFSSANHVCPKLSVQPTGSLVSVANSLQGVGLLYSVPNTNLVANSLTKETQLHVSQILGFPLPGIPSSVPHDNCRVEHCVPDRIQRIIGDGNCLFASLVVACGGFEHQAGVLRQFIVDNMHLINYPAQTLEVSLPRTDGRHGNRTVIVNSTNEYLQLSRMGADGVYGTDVEIFAFCQLTGISVFVYHTLWKYWLVYRSANPTNTQCFHQADDIPRRF